MKWNELKDFCNSLNEEQLEEKVRLFLEEDVILDINAENITEDQYTDTESDGCYSLEDAGLNKVDVEELGLIKVYSKGLPILFSI